MCENHSICLKNNETPQQKSSKKRRTDLEGVERVRQLDELQNDRLILAEHVARGDAVEDRVADLAGAAPEGRRQREAEREAERANGGGGRVSE